MRHVKREELLDYVTYQEQRAEMLPNILSIKEVRRIHVGENLTFLFDNRDTIRYQVQEMMRTERIVKEEDILHELETYNELLGSSGELGCTLLIEITTEEERAIKLREWMGLIDHLYMKLSDGTKVRATYDERQVGEDRLSSVQYLKFNTEGRVPVAIGTDFNLLNEEADLTDVQIAALTADLSDDF